VEEKKELVRKGTEVQSNQPRKKRNNSKTHYINGKDGELRKIPQNSKGLHELF